jgi:hypothetical protein
MILTPVQRTNKILSQSRNDAESSTNHKYLEDVAIPITPSFNCLLASAKENQIMENDCRLLQNLSDDDGSHSQDAGDCIFFRVSQHTQSLLRRSFLLYINISNIDIFSIFTSSAIISLCPYCSNWELHHDKVKKSLDHADISLVIFYINDSAIIGSKYDKLIRLQNTLVK